MNVFIRIVVILLISWLGTSLKAQSTFLLTVKVEGIDNNKGKVFVALYNSEMDFLDKFYKGGQSPIENNLCQVTIADIPEGVYAVSIFHDENDNGKMDTNFMGIPKEDYACSNNAKGFMGPPKWEDAKFELKENKTITINL